jgi:hypothetical protein
MIRFKVKRASILNIRRRNADSYSDCTIIGKTWYDPETKRFTLKHDFFGHNFYIVIERPRH